MTAITLKGLCKSRQWFQISLINVNDMLHNAVLYQEECFLTEVPSVRHLKEWNVTNARVGEFGSTGNEVQHVQVNRDVCPTVATFCSTKETVSHDKNFFRLICYIFMLT